MKQKQPPLSALLSFLNRDLDYGEPFLRVFLVPYPVHIAGTRSIDNRVRHFGDFGKELEVALAQLAIWAIDLHTDGCREFRQGLEFHDVGVFPGRCNLLAILYLEIFRLVFLCGLDGEAIARFRTLAAEPGHFRGYDTHKVHSEGIVVRQYGPVVSNGD